MATSLTPEQISTATVQPNLSDTSVVFQTASTGRAEDLQLELKTRALSSLYYFCKVVLNFNALSPQFHYDRCKEIEDSIRCRKRGILWPRGHFKSTIIKAYILWRLVGGGWKLAHPDLPDFDYQVSSLDPRNQRIFLCGESDTRVINALRNIKWHLTSNTMFRWLFPEVCWKDTNEAPLWRDDAITLPRTMDYDEPTIRAVGVGTKVTGYHGDIFLFDDLIGEHAAGSEAVMEKANTYVEYSVGLANDPEVVEWLLAGTRWKFGKADTYGKLMDELPYWEDVEGAPHGIKWFIYAAITEEGTPIFPERFTLKTLQDLNGILKDYKFSCQYLNTPATAEGGDFPDALVKSFYGEGTRIKPTDGTEEVDINQLLRISFYDLSSGGASARCENAIVVLGTHSDGRRFVLDAFLKNCGYRAALEAWYKLNDQYICYQNWYENKGAQKEIEEFDILVRHNGCELCRVQQAKQPESKILPHRKLRMQGYGHKDFGGNKEDRIRLYMQATVEEGRLYINVKLRALRNQVVGFPHFHLKDGADALATAIHLSRAPMSQDDETSDSITEELKQEPPEARVHTDRCYGGYV